jgi:hypothetical protein
MGFHPVAVVGKFYKNMKETAVYKGKNNTKSQNTQNRKTNKQIKKTNIKRILTNLSQ